MRFRLRRATHLLGALIALQAMTTGICMAKKANYKPTLKDLDGHFPMQVPTSLDAWEKTSR